MLQKRPGITAIPGLTLFAAIVLMGAVLLAPMMLFEVARGPALPQTATAWLAVAAIAFIPFGGRVLRISVRRPPLRPGDDGDRVLHADTLRRRARATLPRRAFHLYHLVGFALILPGVILATARFPSRRSV